MRSYNHVTLMGHLAQDPELRQTKNGKTLVNFAIATDRDWMDSTGEKMKQVDFHKVIAWQKLAEICGKFLVKGSAVMVQGRLSNRSFESKTGEKRHVTEVVADDINIITFKKAADGEERVALTDVNAK